MQARDATNPSPPAACTPWPTDLSDLLLSYEAVISTLNKRTGVPQPMLYAKSRHWATERTVVPGFDGFRRGQESFEE